ncbi:PPK2 family polyphosphate--nucleotide phosphotransferase [Fulvitalea axinellae]|uniref:PPK2 family polyphosphate--nucleotide phosphotransferase n=1 Tax=Fulvitalea axinellae TaxID=1182444 RepID=A0AAU9CU94_9BACT|nr:PPK2 family polyphosphate--nucleotide phosphotransferase [Fulvitalea axinellae]
MANDNFYYDRKFYVNGEKPIRLNDFPTDYTEKYKDEDDAEDRIADIIKQLNKLQYRLYAECKYSFLIILQATDAAGKDGVLRHVLRGINPQGCQVHSFKSPTHLELRHDWMWRHYRALPERGMIGIFNRSYYENVLVTKVHPEFILNENIPGIESTDRIDRVFWDNRYKDIRNFEEMLSRNGTVIMKLFLNMSKDEQARRFLSRIDEESKNWKISPADFAEREHWDDYRLAFEDMINNTSTPYAPWHVIPSDHKWFSRVLIAEILMEKMASLRFITPEVTDEMREKLKGIRKILEKELKKEK